MKKLVICFSVLAMLMAGQTFAGTFSTSALWNDAGSGISSDKTYTHAYNLCKNETDLSINGVDFIGVTDVNPSGLDFTTSGFGHQIVTSNPATILVTGDTNTLLTEFHVCETAATVTLTGLIAGGEYITTFYNATWGDTGARVFDITTSYDTTPYEFDLNYTDDPGNGWAHYGNMLMYSYTPTSDSIAFTFTPTSGGVLHLYGFTNEAVSVPDVPDVPEPSMVLLVCAGLAMLVVRKRFA